MRSIQLRPAAADDYEAYCRLIPALGTGDPPPSPEDWSARIVPGCVLLESEGDVIAGAWFRRVGSWAHVIHVIVDPAWQGRGLGSRLMDAVAARLRHEGIERWFLNVKRDNVPALRLYESAGLRQRIETSALRVPWSIVAALPRPARTPKRRAFPRSDDAAEEARWSIVPGSISAARDRGERAIRLGAPSEALAVFNPSFPGAWCFRLGSPTLARPLLEALRSHAPGDVPYLGVIAEDPGLADLLRRHGAEVRFELYQLRGEVPARPATPNF